MSGQHTQGRIESYSPSYTSLVFLKISAEEGKIGLAYDEANARRLAACWNDCEGFETDSLENIIMLGDTMHSRFAALKVECDQAQSELAAARALLQEVIKSSEGITVEGYEDEFFECLTRIRSFLEGK